jgi:biotin carboxyl carrier protein
LASRNVRSAIAGTVLEIHKTVGETVSAGDAVVTLECMKMEIPIEAPAAGTVVSVAVTLGETIAKDQLVFILQS